MNSLVLGALQPSTSGTAIVAGLFLAFRHRLWTCSWTQLAILFLLFLNRGNLPLRWHFKILWIGLRARLRWDLANLGFKSATPKQLQLGLQKGALSLDSIGKNPFDIVTVRKCRVSIADSDYNL